VEKVEEVGVAELHPVPLPIEVGQRHQEVGHRPLFAAEENGETSGRFACLVHARMFSRDIWPSPNARIRRLAGFHLDLLRTSPETRGARQRPPGAWRGAFTARGLLGT
jgi:hypothetical protein